MGKKFFTILEMMLNFSLTFFDDLNFSFFKISEGKKWNRQKLMDRRINVISNMYLRNQIMVLSIF